MFELQYTISRAAAGQMGALKNSRKTPTIGVKIEL